MPPTPPHAPLGAGYGCGCGVPSHWWWVSPFCPAAVRKGFNAASPAAALALALALARALDLPLTWVDERYTRWAAGETVGLRAHGSGRLDSAAAVLILLDSPVRIAYQMQVKPREAIPWEFCSLPPLSLRSWLPPLLLLPAR